MMERCNLALLLYIFGIFAISFLLWIYNPNRKLPFCSRREESFVRPPLRMVLRDPKMKVHSISFAMSNRKQAVRLKSAKGRTGRRFRHPRDHVIIVEDGKLVACS